MTHALATKIAVSGVLPVHGTGFVRLRGNKQSVVGLTLALQMVLVLALDPYLVTESTGDLVGFDALCGEAAWEVYVVHY